MNRYFSSCLVVALAAALGGCQASKSSNPLSPSVAGPIPGVEITPPKPVQPANGDKIAAGDPVMLVVGNASTSGVRPLNYLFEVASDADFQGKVFQQSDIAPGKDQTSIRIPDALAPEHTYYWHARAQDGANTGPFSAAIPFAVYTPVVIQPPSPTAPINNAVVSGSQPTFQWANAARTGPAGAIHYALQVAQDQAFTVGLQMYLVAEQPNNTSLTVPADLNAGAQYVWRVRASTDDADGPWSTTQGFRTMAAPKPPPPPDPTPTPSGPAAGDMMNLSQAQVYNSPADVASWPATGSITQLAMSPSSGLTFQFTTSNRWPDVVPPGWSGPLQYTVWAVVNVNGTWCTSGFIQMWRGRDATGAPILAEFARNWAYDSRWGPMAGYHPHAGEQMGFFLTAGDARGQTGVTSVRERTNVVVVSLPGGDSGVFNFR